jgi:threonyl-tRNA synthetase
MGRSLSAQLKAAASAGAKFVVIVGKDELDAGMLTMRDMSGGAQESLSLAEIEERLKKHFQDYDHAYEPHDRDIPPHLRLKKHSQDYDHA